MAKLEQRVSALERSDSVDGPRVLFVRFLSTLTDERPPAFASIGEVRIERDDGESEDAFCARLEAYVQASQPAGCTLVLLHPPHVIQSQGIASV